MSPNELIVCTAMRFLQRISSPIEIYFRAKILACIWLSWNLEKRRRPGWTNKTMGTKCLWFKQFDNIFLDYYASFLYIWNSWKFIFLALTLSYRNIGIMYICISESFENIFEIDVAEMLELIKITIIRKRSSASFLVVELGTSEGSEWCSKLILN